MELTLLMLSLLGLLALGVPVAFSLLGASLLTFAVMDIPMVVPFQQLAAGMNIFALIAIPFFVLAGDLLHHAGIARRLVEVADAMLGRARGGLGQVNVGASMMFGAVSGSAIASVSALGATLMPLMREKGYDDDYTVNVTSTAAITGLLIPPSHNMIIYAAAAGIGVSVQKLFLAGVVPGLITGGLLMLVAWIISVRRGYPAGRFPGWPTFLHAFGMAIPGMMTAVIIVVGVLGGVFTPTESSAIAVLYTALVAVLVYRSLGWNGFVRAVTSAVRTTAMVLLIIGAAGAFGWLVAVLEVPAKLGALITSLSDNRIAVLLIINLLLLLLGTFMDMAPLIVITTPILLPVAQSVGVDPTHFGIIMMLNLGVGLVTPPVGSVLFVGAAIGRLSIEQAARTIWPFYLALFAALMFVTYVPALSMTLPGLFGGG